MIIVKLRTRIILLNCIAVLVASLLGELIIWVITAKNYEEEAILKGYQNYYEVVNEIKQEVDEETDFVNDDIYLNFMLKKMRDEFNICYMKKGGGSYNNTIEEVYNNTVFRYEELSQLDYSTYNSVYCSDLNLEGRRYIVFHTVLGDNIYIYRIEDITYVAEKMRDTAILMFVITVTVTAITLFVLSWILKREFVPLQELNRTAKSMAEGFYDQRVSVKRKDEIGQLGENYNKMAEAVESRTYKLEMSEKRKTLFMGNLTHELKTPMTAISGYAQTLLSTKINEQDREEALLYIYEECERLERLSKKMMKLLEIDQDAKLDFVEMPVRKIFEAAGKSCQAILKDKNISLECIESGQKFSMDIDLMTDVIINLIDNAVKASEPGQKIILRAYGNCIEVQDFGKGIPKEEQKNILEPFYMIDKSRSRKNGGAGLGLALVAIIAQKHNINIEIVSDTDQGCRFILQFV